MPNKMMKNPQHLTIDTHSNNNSDESDCLKLRGRNLADSILNSEEDDSHSRFKTLKELKLGFSPRANSLIQRETPKYTDEAVVVIGEIGRGSSSRVYKCIYVPTLTLVALKNVKLTSESRLRQIETELKTLHKVSPSRSTFLHEKCLQEPPRTNERQEEQARKQRDIIDFWKIETDVTNAKDYNDDNFNLSDSILDDVMSDSPNGTTPEESDNDRTNFTHQEYNTEIHQIEIEEEYFKQISEKKHKSAAANEESKRKYGKNDEDVIIPLEVILLPLRNHCKNSPFIVSLYDAYSTPEDQSVSIVLEYMGGGSLQDLIVNQSPKGKNDIDIVAYSILHALRELHTRNIIHRDIKPANVLCTIDGLVKLSDFGLSFDEAYTDVNTSFEGSISFMSPERLRGEAYGKSCDIWAYAMTLVQFISGKNPFADVKGYWNILAEIQEENFGECLISPLPVSDELKTFLEMCFVKDQKKRKNVSQLFHSEYIQQVIAKGITVHPRIKIPNISTPFPVVRSVVDAVLLWYPEHIDEIVSFAAPTVLNKVQVNGSERDLSPTSPIEIEKSLFSRKAVRTLAEELNVKVSDIMKILIEHHLNEVDDEEVATIKSSLRNRCNPLFPYEYVYPIITEKC